MPVFRYTFTVDAPLEAVSAFHHSTDVLKRLTPPPLWVQIHHFGPMVEGMVAEFTLWVGPLPLRWRARHIEVGPHGFTDVQASGPLASWRHTHRFTPESPGRTRIEEHIEYDYPNGWRGLLARLLFNPAGLYALFTYRQLATRRGVQR